LRRIANAFEISSRVTIKHVYDHTTPGADVLDEGSTPPN
jgi:hypothetical protein